MKQYKEPQEPPPEDSLAKLAEFTRRILQVKRSEIDELQRKDPSDGPKKIDEPCPGT